MVTYIFSSWGRKLLHWTQAKFENIPILGMQFDTARPLYYCSNLYYTSKYHRCYDVWVKSPNDLRGKCYTVHKELQLLENIMLVTN